MMRFILLFAAFAVCIQTFASSVKVDVGQIDKCLRDKICIGPISQEKDQSPASALSIQAAEILSQCKEKIGSKLQMTSLSSKYSVDPAAPSNSILKFSLVFSDGGKNWIPLVSYSTCKNLAFTQSICKKEKLASAKILDAELVTRTNELAQAEKEAAGDITDSSCDSPDGTGGFGYRRTNSITCEKICKKADTYLTTKMAAENVTEKIALILADERDDMGLESVSIACEPCPSGTHNKKSKDVDGCFATENAECRIDEERYNGNCIPKCEGVRVDGICTPTQEQSCKDYKKMISSVSTWDFEKHLSGKKMGSCDEFKLRELARTYKNETMQKLKETLSNLDCKGKAAQTESPRVNSFLIENLTQLQDCFPVETEYKGYADFIKKSKLEELLGFDPK